MQLFISGKILFLCQWSLIFLMLQKTTLCLDPFHGPCSYVLVQYVLVGMVRENSGWSISTRSWSKLLQNLRKEIGTAPRGSVLLGKAGWEKEKTTALRQWNNLTELTLKFLWDFLGWRDSVSLFLNTLHDKQYTVWLEFLLCSSCVHWMHLLIASAAWPLSAFDYPFCLSMIIAICY